MYENPILELFIFSVGGTDACMCHFSEPTFSQLADFLTINQGMEFRFDFRDKSSETKTFCKNKEGKLISFKGAEIILTPSRDGRIQSPF